MKRLGRVRGIGVAALWLLFVPVAIVFLGLTNLIGAPNGWLYSLLVLGPAAPLTWFLVRGTRRWRGWLTAAVAVTAFLVIWLPAVATPDHARVAQQARAIPAPPNSVYLGRDPLGNDLCFQRCPQILLYYAVPSADEAVRWLNGWAARQGWTRSTLFEGGPNGGWCKGDFSLLAHAGADVDRPTIPEREAPPGTERFLLQVRANCQ
ncbi:MAG: hypothetical protein ACTHJJ_13670 [Intrasporangium sp.]|uniref:hypothetical protein n=1 Tax=Intrasporangium sp. TaxID=1925024 RepID=UPI003F7DADBB